MNDLETLLSLDGATLKRCRNAAGLTQQQLVEASKVSMWCVQNMEANGCNDTQVRNLRAILQIFSRYGVSLHGNGFAVDLNPKQEANVA